MIYFRRAVRKKGGWFVGRNLRSGGVGFSITESVVCHTLVAEFASTSYYRSHCLLL